MIKSIVALRYAKALFNLDVQNGNIEKRLDDFEFILNLLKNNQILLKFLKAPQIELQEKENFLASFLKNKVDDTFFHFLLCLIEKGKLDYLSSIASQYRLMVDEYLGIWEAKIVTAVALGKDLEKKLKEKLEKFFRKKMKITKEVNPKIIGGAVLVVGDQMIDWSVMNRLKKIKENLLTTHALTMPG